MKLKTTMVLLIVFSFIATIAVADMTIDANGNVGMGTDTPSSTLHVENTTLLDNAAIYGESSIVDAFGHYGIGVTGVGLWTGVEGYVDVGPVNGDGIYYGVVGDVRTNNTGAETYGIYGYAYGGGDNYGVYGYAAGGLRSYGVYGTAAGAPTSYAGYFLGRVHVQGNTHVQGTLTAFDKQFIQPHAKDPSKEISYIATEAPEALVMHRGTGQLIDGKAVIDLPEYFSVVASQKGLQVQVTPTEDCNGIFVAHQDRDKIEVKELMAGKHNAKFNYLITAVRSGYERHQPIVENTHFRPQADETAEQFEQRFSKDDMSTQAIRSMLMANGILTGDGKLNAAKVKELGWDVAEESSSHDPHLRARFHKK